MKEVLPGWLMVGLPDMTGDVTLRSTAHCNSSISFYNKFTQKETLVVTPPGSYEIVGIVSEVSEEVAKWVVEKVDFKTVSGAILYHNYDALGIDFRDIVEAAFDTAKESLPSLARSNGFEPERTLLIRKK